MEQDGALRAAPAPEEDAVDDSEATSAGPPGDLGDVGRWPTGRVLSTAARLVEHAWDDALRAWDLNHARYAVLALLLAGPATQRELARRAGMEEQTMGRMLRGMEENGHVRRERDPADRRRSVVTLTPDGRRALAAVVDSTSAQDLLADVLAGSGHDGEQLRATLLHLVQHFSRRRWPGPGDAPGDG